MTGYCRVSFDMSTGNAMMLRGTLFIIASSAVESWIGFETETSPTTTSFNTEQLQGDAICQVYFQLFIFDCLFYT